MAGGIYAGFVTRLLGVIPDPGVGAGCAATLHCSDHGRGSTERIGTVVLTGLPGPRRYNSPMKTTISLTLLLCVVPTWSVTAAGPDLKRGELLYQTCAACHSILGDGIGPDITGIIGQKSAQIAGFKYSEAMKKANLVWNEPALRAFIANPQVVVKGTTMAFPGYTAPGDQDDVIAYMKSQQ